MSHPKHNQLYSNKENKYDLDKSKAQNICHAPQKQQKRIGNFIIGKVLGQGTFGKVRLGIHTLTGQKVAIKFLQKKKISQVADIQRVTRQIHILKLIRHPNLIQLYQIIQTPKQLLLIMQFMQEGQLFDLIVKKKRIPQQQACAMFHQIISAIEYIHNLGITHRDLKPENILLNQKGNLKVVDFGLSNMYKNGELLKTPCGSPCYAAPEMIQGEKYEGLKVDIWSSGIILFAMLCGYLPFQDESISVLYKKVLSNQYKFHSSVSKNARDLIQKILTNDPTKRYTIQQIRSHPWMTSLSSIQGNLNKKGIMIGYDKIPISQDILNQITRLKRQKSKENLNIDTEYIKKCLQANRHNDMTVLYYLMGKKYIRQNQLEESMLFECCPTMRQSQKKSKNKENNSLCQILVDNFFTKDSLSNCGEQYGHLRKLKKRNDHSKESKNKQNKHNNSIVLKNSLIKKDKLVEKSKSKDKPTRAKISSTQKYQKHDQTDKYHHIDTIQLTQTMIDSTTNRTNSKPKTKKQKKSNPNSQTKKQLLQSSKKISSTKHKNHKKCQETSKFLDSSKHSPQYNNGHNNIDKKKPKNCDYYVDQKSQRSKKRSTSKNNHNTRNDGSFCLVSTSGRDSKTRKSLIRSKELSSCQKVQKKVQGANNRRSLVDDHVGRKYREKFNQSLISKSKHKIHSKQKGQKTSQKKKNRITIVSKPQIIKEPKQCSSQPGISSVKRTLKPSKISHNIHNNKNGGNSQTKQKILLNMTKQLQPSYEKFYEDKQNDPYYGSNCNSGTLTVKYQNTLTESVKMTKKKKDYQKNNELVENSNSFIQEYLLMKEKKKKKSQTRDKESKGELSTGNALRTLNPRYL